MIGTLEGLVQTKAIKTMTGSREMVDDLKMNLTFSCVCFFFTEEKRLSTTVLVVVVGYKRGGGHFDLTGDRCGQTVTATPMGVLQQRNYLIIERDA